jgi:hypothetical protein
MTHNFANTTNFQLDTTDSFWNGLTAAQKTNVGNNATFLHGQVEPAFTTTTGWFGTDITRFGTSHRQEVAFDLPDDSGASNNGYGSTIEIAAQADNSGPSAGPIVCMLWMAEWSEILMSLTSNWHAGDSSGEGLSQWCALQLFLSGHTSYYTPGNNRIFVQNWLNGDGSPGQGSTLPNSARSDWVNHTYGGSTVNGTFVHGDGDPVSFGCALAFIYYLTTQLGFTINEVIERYNNNLASCYHAVTADSTDPFSSFLGLINHVYPSSSPATLSGPNPNDIFPIAQVEFYAQKNTFGSDEARDIIDHQGGLVSSAFWVVIEGLSKQAFQALGVRAAPFTGAFAGLSGVTITANPAGAEFENGMHPKAPQRIRIPYDITLDSRVLSHFPATGVSAPLDLNVTLTAGGQTVSGSGATMEFELIAGGDPYFANIDPAQQNQPYLSQDLRVFRAAPAVNNVPFPGGPTFGSDSVAGAYSYLQALLQHLNGTPAFTNPSGTDPFSLLPDQAGEGQTDSSVAPYALRGFGFANNYNFVIARVRMRGSAGPADEATDVRVFFRVFASQSPDTDYDPNGTYASQPDAAHVLGNPVPGVGNTTVPFFATGNAGSQTDYRTPNGPNIKTIAIPAGQDYTWVYYGCFLNFYDPANSINGQQVQALLPGTHHCVVAQIVYDRAPVPTGVSPMSWDQLAQRNLQFTQVDNPGPAEAHRAPQTFDLRPSRLVGGSRNVAPDQLMIDWGNVPRGSVCSIYWPAVAAAEVIALARTWGGATGLSMSSPDTLTLAVDSGVSYLPIPTGAGQNFAGLLTLKLPMGIRAGQEFEVLVRRISTRFGRKSQPVPVPELNAAPARDAGKATAEHAKAVVVIGDVKSEALVEWRYVVGSFIVRVPVTTGDEMLVPEQITLAIMKWRLANLSPGNRWAPVLARYIEYLSARLDGIGGDAAQVPASLTWVPALPSGGTPPSHHRELCGKVAEVLFDCHGEFDGFVLQGCCDQRPFRSRERGVADLVLRACRDNLTVCVRLCHDSDRIEGLVLGA